MKKVLPLTPPPLFPVLMEKALSLFPRSSSGNLFYFLFPHSMVGTEIELYCTIHSFILSFIQEVGRKRGWGGWSHVHPPPHSETFISSMVSPHKSLAPGALHHHHLLLLLLFSGECFL